MSTNEKNEILALIQTVTAEHNEFMQWHEAEKNLLAAVSLAKKQELEAELTRARDVLRSSIERGQQGSKEHRKIREHTAAVKLDLEEFEVLEADIREGADDRSHDGVLRLGAHLGSRRALYTRFFDREIAAATEQAEKDLHTIAQSLAVLVGRAQLKFNIAGLLTDPTMSKNIYQMEPDPRVRMGYRDPEKMPTVSEVLKPLLDKVIKPLLAGIDLELDQEAISSIKANPPTNLLRLDLVGSPAARHKYLKTKSLKQEEAAATASVARAKEWSHHMPEDAPWE